MRSTTLLVTIVCVAVAACGTDGKTTQTKPVTEAPTGAGLPERPLPAAIHGAWTETRYWSEGRTDGPAFYSKASVEANAISLTSGETSKDSGEWTIAGRCGVSAGEGTETSPYVVQLRVEQAVGGDLHPAPAEVGQTVEVKIHLAGGVLRIDVPGGSMKLSREGPQQIATEPTGSIEPEFACAADGDCLNSCNHGAVNATWYAERYPGGERCEDGCTSKGTEPARCIDGLCVAFRLGQRSEECTRRAAEVIPGPGPAHACAADDDCSVSCAYGAVNREWYSYSVDPAGECKDGCASKGASAKCEDGTCVGYLRGERSEGCTHRNIHSSHP